MSNLFYIVSIHLSVWSFDLGQCEKHNFKGCLTKSEKHIKNINKKKIFGGFHKTTFLAFIHLYKNVLVLLLIGWFVKISYEEFDRFYSKERTWMRVHELLVKCTSLLRDHL